MNSYVILALIARYTDLPTGEAEKIASELDHTIQPSTYKAAQQLIDKLASSAKNKRKLVD